MRHVAKSCLLIGLAFSIWPADAPRCTESTVLTQYECKVLRICEGVDHLFRRHAELIWPGYSLSQSPFIVYIPGKWALLVNRGEDVDEFRAAPAGWPALAGTEVVLHEGQYRDFVGQLMFDVQVGDVSTVAIGFPDSFPAALEHPEVEAFAYIVHEAFHQYQHRAFGEIPWAREEKYPIEDVDNGALAFLEMQLLSAAIEAMTVDDGDRTRDLTEQFIAVRHQRWENGEPFVSEYEQGKELLEGTANYVELRCLGLAVDLRYDSPLDEMTPPLADCFDGLTAAERLSDEFNDRMGEGFIPVEDMSRNRIYPVGSAQGLLLDYFGIPWKGRAEKAGPDFTFVRLLEDGLGVDRKRFPSLVEQAKASIGFEGVAASTERSIEEYLRGYAEQLEVFESQPGFRVELESSSGNVGRSRVSRAKKWIVAKGTRCLREHYKVYTLRADDWSLDIHDIGLLEMDDWDARRRTVVFYVREAPSVSVNGQLLELLADGSRQFQNIEMVGDNFRLESSKAGSLKTSGNTLRVSLPTR